MKKNKIIKYLTILLPWFISAIIFKIDKNYYNNLNLPFFAPPSILFAIIWPILYILISISIYKVIDNSNNNYKLTLLTNYISNQLYTLCFFTLKSLFLGFVDSLIVFISSLYLYSETKKIDKTSTKYLIPYILWNLFATILSITIYILN